MILTEKIVIQPTFDNAEMFSEGLSAVKVGDKYGFIDEKGNYVLPLRPYEYLGSVHSGLAGFRTNDKYGFINTEGKEIIKPQFEWVDEFSEQLCVVRIDNGKPGTCKHGYIDKTEKIIIDLQFQYATKFENGQAKFELNNLWGTIGITGKIIEQAKHNSATW